MIPIISLHVPKCAGTSFGQVLARWFLPDFATFYPDKQSHVVYRMGEAPPVDMPIPQAACVHGHFPRSRGVVIPEGRYITVLRDPLQAQISLWRYMIQTGRETRPIEECLETTLPYFQNYLPDEADYIWASSVERLVDDLPKLAKMFKAKSVFIPRRNITHGERPVLSKRLERIVRDRVQEDYIIWERVCNP